MTGGPADIEGAGRGHGCGYTRLRQRAQTAAAGRPAAWAIEGTRHYGLGLARDLAAHGHQVTEIDATRQAGRRRAGKSDPIDAGHTPLAIMNWPRPWPSRSRSDARRWRELGTHAPPGRQCGDGW
ncbi:MAG TPA: hypothetical protein VGI96_45400 [Streptosporangiaceae bacterium]